MNGYKMNVIPNVVVSNERNIECGLK